MKRIVPTRSRAVPARATRARKVVVSRTPGQVFIQTEKSGRTVVTAFGPTSKQGRLRLVSKVESTSAAAARDLFIYAAKAIRSKGVVKVELYLESGSTEKIDTSIVEALAAAGVKVLKIHDVVTRPGLRSAPKKTPHKETKLATMGDALPPDGSAQRTEPSRLLNEIQRRLERLPAASNLTDADIDRAAAAVIDAIPDSPSLESELGPFYTTSGLMRRWHVTRQAINGRVQRKTLLGLPTLEGETCFPSFQFSNKTGTIEVLPGLAEIMKVLAAGGAGPMMIAMWLTAEQPALGDERPIDVIAEERDLGQVMILAERDGERWAS